jgi:hypothetical protein
MVSSFPDSTSHRHTPKSLNNSKIHQVASCPIKVKTLREEKKNPEGGENRKTAISFLKTHINKFIDS